MKYVILDIQAPRDAVASLESMGFHPIFLPPFSALPTPVASHPDMLIFLGAELYCHRDYIELAREELELISGITGLSLAPTDEFIGNEYPHDVLFNGFCAGNILFGKLANLSHKLTDCFEHKVDLRQGYAKCSTCKVTDRAFITADPSIKKALLAQGFDVLEICPGHVSLPGYEYGFIGGASGSDSERVYFCGSLETHPCGQAIAEFCKSHGKEAVSLINAPLYDVGTMIFIENQGE